MYLSSVAESMAAGSHGMQQGGAFPFALLRKMIWEARRLLARPS